MDCIYDRQLKVNTHEEFKKKVHDEAIKIRQQKVKELLEKKEITDLENSIIDQWAFIYGGDAW